jgi:hypothetical protein
MGIQNDGDLFSDGAMDANRRENDELKKALGEAHLDIKILKKLEMDVLRRAGKIDRGVTLKLGGASAFISFRKTGGMILLGKS